MDDFMFKATQDAQRATMDAQVNREMATVNFNAEVLKKLDRIIKLLEI